MNELDTLMDEIEERYKLATGRGALGVTLTRHRPSDRPGAVDFVHWSASVVDYTRPTSRLVANTAEGVLAGVRNNIIVPDDEVT